MRPFWKSSGAHKLMPLKCPGCDIEISGKVLALQPQFRHYRICPHCGTRFTVDAGTKRRQAIAIVLAIVSLYLTIRLMKDGVHWLMPACVSYAVLAAYIYFASIRVTTVPFQKH
jgi:hypothetical protein